MKKLLITPSDEGGRIDKYLLRYMPNINASFLYKMFRKKNIMLNEKKIRGNEHLVSGDIITVYFKDETVEKFKGTGKNGANTGFVADTLNIVYEDENICIVNKPSGLLSQKASPDDYSLVDMLKNRYEKKHREESFALSKPALCNRLDRNTSGIVVCAYNLSSSRDFNTMIKNNHVEKRYIAVCSGKVDKELILKGYLKKDCINNTVNEVSENSPDGKYAETHIRPLFCSETLSLLDINLITGRTHQIRAHLKGTGHPIIGDKKYGGKTAGNINTQMLHSYRLTVKKGEGHLSYLSGKSFFAPLPDSFKEYLASHGILNNCIRDLLYCNPY